MFIEIYPNQFINLTKIREIKPSENELGILIDGELFKYDSNEDRNEMLSRISKVIKTRRSI